MRLRPPSVPLITVDPYFSLWSPADHLTDAVTAHWTGSPQTMVGYASIDGVSYRFLGRLHPGDDSPAMEELSRDCDALHTKYVFAADGVELSATFMTPLLMDDLDVMSRPVSYLRLSVRSTDRACHMVGIRLAVSEEICLDKRGQDDVTTEIFAEDGLSSVKIGSVRQPILARSGDNIRIDWGYFYMTAADAVCGAEKIDIPYSGDNAPADYDPATTFVTLSLDLDTMEDTDALVTFAYDDVYSILYFGEKLHAYWNRNGMTIREAIAAAHREYPTIEARCQAFADRLFADGVKAGGEKYAEILELSYRQSIAAHKAVVDDRGELLFISKECFSNGCAATVDVSYPSIPLYLLYNPELVRGMMRPIVRYADSDAWRFDFSPHDCGQYPILSGQVYANNAEEWQMPVEEAGNMLVMVTCAALADGDLTFAREHMALWEKWVQYLLTHGEDPENQLCTDDFAGHLAHNCNLSLKAMMGIAALAILYRKLDRAEEADALLAEARKMAKSFARRAANGDSSYRLAYDRPGTWSMKYNIVWDKLWHTGIMEPSVLQSEFASYRRHVNPYGMPLDCRETYTKSDWLIWTATLANERADFEEYVAPLWEAYHRTLTRVPMTDWYYTVTANQRGFQNRTVVGGHFMKLLEYSGKMRVE